MSKVGIIYWSSTGNTEAMAQAVEEGAKAAGADVEIMEVADADVDKALSFDVLALGCPAMGDEELEEGEFEPFFSDLEGKLSGKKVALFGSYDWGDGEWMRTWCGRAKDAGAELVFLPIYYQEASLILAQADSMGFETKFFGCDGMDGILGVENFDTSLAEGLMLLTPFAADSTDEKTQNFVKAYKDAYKDTPNQFAADAYDAVYAVKAAAEKEDVKAELKDGYLTVSAETNTKKDEKAEDGKYIRRERYSGSCSRSFYVGDGVKQEDIKAKFEDGTLKLFVPKEAAKPAVEQKKYISIEG